jgi:hypothetical protein
VLSSPFVQGRSDRPCLNAKCPDRKKKGRLTPIALMPAEPVKGVHLIGRWSVGVQLISLMCPECYHLGEKVNQKSQKRERVNRRRSHATAESLAPLDRAASAPDRDVTRNRASSPGGIGP